LDTVLEPPVSPEPPAIDPGRLDALYGVPLIAGVVTVAVGLAVSMTIAFWPPRLEAPPTAGSVSVALLVAVSLIVPPFRVSDVVAL
jgi:hypothetical protein